MKLTFTTVWEALPPQDAGNYIRFNLLADFETRDDCEWPPTRLTVNDKIGRASGCLAWTAGPFNQNVPIDVSIGMGDEVRHAQFAELFPGVATELVPASGTPIHAGSSVSFNVPSPFDASDFIFSRWLFADDGLSGVTISTPVEPSGSSVVATVPRDIQGHAVVTVSGTNPADARVISCEFQLCRGLGSGDLGPIEVEVELP